MLLVALAMGLAGPTPAEIRDKALLTGYGEVPCRIGSADMSDEAARAAAASACGEGEECLRKQLDARSELCFTFLRGGLELLVRRAVRDSTTAGITNWIAAKAAYDEKVWSEAAKPREPRRCRAYKSWQGYTAECY